MSIEETFANEHPSPQSWNNGPGDTYGWHSHGYHKVLYCVRGCIVFHLRDGDRGAWRQRGSSRGRASGPARW
jgi:hypothetical protein